MISRTTGHGWLLVHLVSVQVATVSFLFQPERECVLTIQILVVLVSGGHHAW